MNIVKLKKNTPTYKGWLFEIILEGKAINISSQLRSYINESDLLKIKSNLCISKFIKKKLDKSNIFYWRISNKNLKNWLPITILGGIPFTLDLKNEIKHNSIKVVYFINADISNCYLKVMSDQLDNLLTSKIFNSSNIKLFFIIICSDLKKRKNIKNLIYFKKVKKYIDFEIEFSSDKHKEFEGINKVWNLSKIKSNHNDLIIYFHAKGISYMQNKFLYIRQPLEKFIFKLLIGKWEQNIGLINRFNSIYKLGTLSGGNGWLWFNFWIAKASYISNLEKPVKRNRACYYEDWLGRYLITKESKNIEKYKNEYDEKFVNTINNTLSLLSKPSKNKFNIGTPCKVEKGGFVGLGIVKLKYRLWYYFFVILNKFGINKGNKDRFKFY